MTGSRRGLVAENALLHQQLIILQRQVKPFVGRRAHSGELLKLAVKVSKRTVKS